MMNSSSLKWLLMKSSVKVAGDRKNINEVLFGWNRLIGIKKGSQRWGGK